MRDLRVGLLAEHVLLVSPPRTTALRFELAGRVARPCPAGGLCFEREKSTLLVARPWLVAALRFAGNGLLVARPWLVAALRFAESAWLVALPWLVAALRFAGSAWLVA